MKFTNSIKTRSSNPEKGGIISRYPPNAICPARVISSGAFFCLPTRQSRGGSTAPSSILTRESPCTVSVLHPECVEWRGIHVAASDDAGVAGLHGIRGPLDGGERRFPGPGVPVLPIGRNVELCSEAACGEQGG